ncbi:hypothetical protein B0H14DRAFT_2785959 [Mycena olivaceomarginata]|nr:hypothetical protein B0H14DRAFT_2785959 [Mycena olivaceomarginata]
MPSFVTVSGWLLALAVAARSQQISPSWRKPNMTTSLADRISIAGAAVEKTINFLGPNGLFNADLNEYAKTGVFYSQLAELDIFANQNLYEDGLKRNFALVQEISKNFSNELIYYGLLYGHAAARAYAAYKDQDFLEYAIDSWLFGRTYTLSQENVASGMMAGKTFTIANPCQGASMAGGTFYLNDTTDPQLNVLSTGNYAVLSALLAEATPDPMYLQAAEQSTAFIQAHLLSIENVVQDTISGRANESCALNGGPAPYNSGLMIEALAILASITKNATTRALLGTIIQTAIVNTAWQTGEGIIARTGPDGQYKGDISLVQGLGVAYSRNVTTPALRAYIEAYLAVQFNAVLDLATSGGSNIYGSAWIGPPSSVLAADNQIAALSVLISAIPLQNETEPTPSSASISASSSASASASSTPTHVSSRSPSVAPIVGGTIGGISLLLAVAFTIWFVRRRPPGLPMERAESTTRSTAAESNVQPFTETSSSSRQENNLANRPQKISSSKGMQGGVVTAEGTASSPLNGRVLRAHADEEHSSEMRVGPQSSTALPTEELLRLLTQRLQNRGLDEQEAPPSYPGSNAS